MLADSHCHLDDKQFDADRTEILNRAREAGVEYMLSIGTGDGPPDLEVAIRIAETGSNIFATVGVHPNDGEKADAKTFSDLEHLIAHPKVRALGEIGLDYHWGVPKEAQTPVFIRQLEIAKAARIPVVIHTRDAWDDTLALLRAHWYGCGLDCVMHCFTGNTEQAQTCLDMGFTLAFGGVVTFPKAAEVREAVKITPVDRMLLETDAPYLAPAPHRGKRNEPAFVAHTATVVAKEKSISVEELAAVTTANFLRIFRIAS